MNTIFEGILNFEWYGYGTLLIIHKLSHWDKFIFIVLQNIGSSSSEAWKATEDDQYDYKLGWLDEGINLLPFDLINQR